MYLLTFLTFSADIWSHSLFLLWYNVRVVQKYMLVFFPIYFRFNWDGLWYFLPLIDMLPLSLHTWNDDTDWRKSWHPITQVDSTLYLYITLTFYNGKSRKTVYNFRNVWHEPEHAFYGKKKWKKTIAINGFFLTAITDFNRLLNISSHGNEKQQRGYFPVNLSISMIFRGRGVNKKFPPGISKYCEKTTSIRKKRR